MADAADAAFMVFPIMVRSGPGRGIVVVVILLILTVVVVVK